MLIHLHIRDFAIIDSLDLELRDGMSALTGETGAGKSILVDALGLVLGDRANSSTVRHGADKAEINAEFELSDGSPALAWLDEQELADAEAGCHLRRIIGADGRSRAFINGRSMPIQVLKELGEYLVDIHGQHEHQSLTRRDVQLAMLDTYGEHGGELKAVAEAYAQWQTVQRRLKQLQADAADRDSRLDLLRFQVRELDALALKPGEYVELDAEHRRLANAGRLLEGSQAALDAAYDGEETSAQALLSQAVAQLDELRNDDPALQPIHETLNSALINLQEGAEDLRHYFERLELDPARRDWVEERIATIQRLARKHQTEADALPGLLDEMQAELDALENADVSLEKLRKEVEDLATQYRDTAGQLSRKRSQTGKALADRVSEAMHELGMPGGRFEIHLETPEPPRFAANGWDRIEFRVSANPGQPPQSLARVASGGELSRISLAIQVIAANATGVPVMVFDEVDAGVGGGVAEIVGKRLRALGEARQVLCVTHLPQVAAQAHNQLKVTKLTGKDTTRTSIKPLDSDERVEEVARMLGGVKITDTTRDHAREMIAGPRRAGRRSKRA